MLVVMGLMSRCANQVVMCLHGHLDMLMGNHGAMEGVDFSYWCLRMAYLMHLYAVKTRIQVAFPLYYYIEVMAGAFWL